MCLATVYKESDNTVIMQNAARIDVDGDTVTSTDIIGDETKLSWSATDRQEVFVLWHM